ncbi:ubiquitin carboxyl-terminal hydrolase MINDY-3 homolog isoform X2 [Cephus cinctus]|uniref:Ubiquitin carboxyl-terminal hydrolase MINDY n=1 Tax=Cephus cinctus TaxID=211228 RepID=A0AAJ7RCE4_CEPCN|nr:ubiquitin carboxyl-terminal hydrolase MINDY-3 homolog isoform X2 [Cephus cinctus]
MLVENCIGAACNSCRITNKLNADLWCVREAIKDLRTLQVMAENVATKDAEIVRNIKILLWGPSVKEDVFKRWAQGFYFSTDEPTALVQTEGGPCAVIAPVQAFILKQLLLEREVQSWKDIKVEKCDQLLVRAMTEIVAQAADMENPKYSIVHTEQNNMTVNGDITDSNNTAKVSTVLLAEEDRSTSGATMEKKILVADDIDQVEKFFTEKINTLKDSFGILLLLYTVVCTKGITGMKSEMSDPTEPVIDSTYGYGSQSLINLMLTGRAVSHVWDHDQDVGGLKLRGIDKQNSVGFLALLEHLRYCEVGTFLKSPSHPVWVLGSETHLTVLFSPERQLVSPETPTAQARRVFKKFDPEGNNFISADLLQDVLSELGLVADSEYVEIMKKKLDSETLGIILLAAFMDEFFPEEQRTCPDTFPLFHYNGLPRSNPDNKVKYHRGQAVLLECTVKCILDSNPMLTVLQTKWPSIETQWDLNKTPSLN